MEYDKKYQELIRKIVLNSIDTNSYAVFLFGSRVRSRHAKGADFDIGVLGKQALPVTVMVEIKDKIESSIVPYQVDIIDFYEVDPEFKSVALKDIQIWNLPNSIKLD